ncbi:hypothetical protein GJ688_04100 [Heliobacillus mobilis]|uniref:Uncharacterized protein n=1 Tax=Heliobacterium mobile TaxID=28064 RepID=A0A6I3SH83_HELMO|nr:hypothetical protein [Heliobacterium mobile]
MVAFFERWRKPREQRETKSIGNSPKEFCDLLDRVIISGFDVPIEVHQIAAADMGDSKAMVQVSFQ